MTGKIFEIDDSSLMRLLTGAEETASFELDKAADWWKIHADEIDAAMSAFVTAPQLQNALEFIQQALKSGRPLTFADCLYQIEIRLMGASQPA